MRLTPEHGQQVVEWVNNNIKHPTECRKRDDILPAIKKMLYFPEHSSDHHLRKYSGVLGLMFVQHVNKVLADLQFPYAAVHEIIDQIKKYYKLPEDLPNEPILGSMLSISWPGHACHKHTDPTSSLLHHVRFNVMLSKPEEGGLPVMNQTVYEPEENEIWICEASNDEHYTTEIIDDKMRCMLSVGYLLTDAQLRTVREIQLTDGSIKCFTSLNQHMNDAYREEMTDDQIYQLENEQFREIEDEAREWYETDHDLVHGGGDNDQKPDETSRPMHLRTAWRPGTHLAY